MSYTKLFNSILDSTIWQEPADTKLVWITLLAMSDKNGEVQASIPGLAARAGVKIAACEAALARLMEPDVYSRTKDDEGRRIEEIEGGWFLLNHAKYRAAASDDDRREKAAIRARRHYEKTKRNGKPNAILTPTSRQISQAEAEANPDANAEADPLKGNKGCFHTSDGKVWKPRFPYPQSPEEMEQTLAQHEVEYCPNWDGNFFLEMQANRWIVDGRPVFDWVALYKSRTDLLKDCAGYDDMLPM